MKITTLKVTLFFVFSLSIFVLLSGYLVYKNILIGLGTWSNASKIQVFIKLNATESDIEGLIRLVKTNPNVKSVKLVDRKHAIEIFQKNLGHYSDGLTDDDLADLIPNSLEVELLNRISIEDRPQIVATLTNQIRQSQASEEVIHSSAWISRFQSIDDNLRSVGFSIFAFVTFLSAVILNLMTRVYVENSKSVIEVYNILGATKWSVYRLFFVDLVVIIFSALITGSVLSYISFNLLTELVRSSVTIPEVLSQIHFFIPSEFFVIFVLQLFIFCLIIYFSIRSNVLRIAEIAND